MVVSLRRAQLQWCSTLHRLHVIRNTHSRPDEMVDRIIRVDHAGEYGADRIYAGQLAVLENTSVGPTIKVCGVRETMKLLDYERLRSIT